METNIRLENVPQTTRHQRRPKLPFALKNGPLQIQPFVCHPVLPGETLHSALLQARTVSIVPVISYLTGWWAEYHLFYVKHRDLGPTGNDTTRDLLTEMHLTSGTSMASLATAAASPTYHNGLGINWARLCLDRVVEIWFRDELEAAISEIDGLPVAKVNYQNWMDSITDDGYTYPGNASEDLPGEGDVPPDVPSAFTTYYTMWQNMRAAGYIDATFEDYLKSFGVKVPGETRVNRHWPEKLGSYTDWVMPRMVVDPADGSIGGMLQWECNKLWDFGKPRLFKEPGFIFGTVTFRPKVYTQFQRSALANSMSDAFHWLPAVLRDEPYTSLRKITDVTQGPLVSHAGASTITTGDYWIDYKDLFMYGDQFIASSAGSGLVDEAYFNSYLAGGGAITGRNSVQVMTDAMRNKLFTPAGTADATDKLLTDGRLDVSISTRLHDSTP